VVSVKGLYFGEEFGLAEAMWVLELKDFPAIVAIDSRGQNLLRKVKSASLRTGRKLIESPDPFVP